MVSSHSKKQTTDREAGKRSPHGATHPFVHYLLLLLAVFVLDCLENWLTPILFPFVSAYPREYYDPLFTTFIIAPFLWLLVLRPLQKGAMDEKIRYEAVKNQVVDAVVTIDLQGIIIAFNTAAERIFGYTPEEISGRNAAELFCDTTLTAENLQHLTASGAHSPPEIHQVVCTRKDGVPLSLEISVSCLQLAGTSQFLVIMRDITRRLNLEKEARQMQARLIQANKMSALGLMVSGVAHEINNPNNFILVNAQQLERSCSDIVKILREYQQENGEVLIGGLTFAELEQHFPEMIAGIIGGTERINDIVNDLKAFSRQDGGEGFKRVDINHAVNHAVAIVRNQILLHTSCFRCELAAALPPVNGNSQQLSQVVINLLMNACQSLPDETRSISLKTYYDAVTGENVIAVADEGEGVSPEARERLLEPFYSTKRNSGGTGLGLSISHSIVKEHNGSLHFESEFGSGSTFFVRIPVTESDHQPGEGEP